MILPHYMLNAAREHRALLLFGFVFVGFFQVLILTLVVGADLLGFVEQFYNRMPEEVQLLFGEQFMAQFSIAGAVAFGYNHPLVIVMLSLVAILLPVRHLAGENEEGTLELLLAMPVRRMDLACSLWAFCGLALLVLVAGCWTGTACGLALFPEARVVPIGNIFKVGFSLWVLMFAIASYSMLIAALAHEGTKATLRAVGLTWVFYFINVAVIMWRDIDFLRPLTVFHYHQPQQLMLGTTLLGRNVLVLILVSLICGVLAILEVVRRDIPG